MWIAYQNLASNDYPPTRGRRHAEPAPAPPVFDAWRVKPGWTQIAPAPVPRAKGIELWTGSELILFGGQSYSGGLAPAGGSAYDPRTDTWRDLATGPLEPRRGEGGVWTGTEMVVWGGSDVVPGDEQGATYSPVLDRWRVLPDSPLETRSPVAIVWTGNEIIVWGDTDRAESSRDGAAFDPSTWRWREISGAPLSLNQGQGVWTGTEMIVFGSLLDGNNNASRRTAEGIAFDPSSGEWRILPESRLSPQASYAVWNGKEMIAWDYGAVARAYDPSADTWRSLPPMPFDSSECYPTSAAGDRVMLAMFCGSAATYDYERNDWIRVDPPTVEVAQPVAAQGVFLVAGSNHESTYNTAFIFRPYSQGTIVHAAPRFWPNIGWFAYSSGPSREMGGRERLGWTSTVDLGTDPRLISDKLEHLGDRDIAVMVSLVLPEDEPNYPAQSFPARDLPLDLSDAEVKSSWAGQPDSDIPEYLVLAEVDEQLVEVRVYFGTQDPDRRMLKMAQRQLWGLILP